MELGYTPPLPAFRRFLEVAYLGRNNVDVDYEILQARLAEEVPANWFYFQLAGHLATLAGNEALHGNLQRQFQLLTDPQLWKWLSAGYLGIDFGRNRIPLLNSCGRDVVKTERGSERRNVQPTNISVDIP